MSRLLRKAAVLMVVATGTVSVPAHAANPNLFQSITPDLSATPLLPRGVDARPIKVVVFLRGDSVAVSQAKAGRELSAGERSSIIAARRSEHQSMYPEIARQGGTVLGNLTGAVNGLKVSIARNRLSALRGTPGVVDVKEVGVYQRTNDVSVPFIGAPLVWQGSTHFQGQGVKVGIIDTGIDYTHANFGGPGTVAAFQAASANSTAAADPALFGPNAPKVKGGIDLVGDAYNAAAAAGSPALTPVPDPNPLDCNGHGSHVAGTAAGFGENADGSTYTGAYSAAAYTPGAFKIGPGVAPKADLYAIRVFGCTGSTDVVGEALDWAVNNGMNVVNLSLGSSWGNASQAETVAVGNAIAAGIQVVISQGNSGPTPYIGGAPASVDGTISVAAMDSTAGTAGATLNLGAAGSILVQDNDAVTFANNTSYPIVVLRNSNGTVSLGCNPNEYDPTQGGVSVVGKMVVTVRGSCARVYRAGAAQHYGAKAALMINSSAGYPPNEGPIPGNDPSTNPFEAVTIPFFGALQSDAPKLTSPAPATVVATNAQVPNPAFERVASFSSGGPRYGDSILRPSLSAPGVAIPSTGSGTGNGAVVESGTSMAAPHVTGVAALVKQANPTWPLTDLRAAVIQSAAPSKLLDLSTRLEGVGVVQPLAATTTQAVMRVPNDSISFGFADLLADFSGQQTVTVHNAATKPVTFNLTSTKVVGPTGTTVSIPSSIAVGANADATFPVTVTVPATAVGATHNADGSCCAFHEVGGYIQATPTNSRLNGNVTLSLPYYLVAYGRSALSTSASSVGGLPTGSNNLSISNTSAVLAGEPDFYATGLTSGRQNVQYADVRAVGVQTIPVSSTDAVLVFAINTFDRVSNPAGAVEWDIYINTAAGGQFILYSTDGANVSSAASVQHKIVSVLYNRSTGATVAIYSADASTDTSTILLPVYASKLGLTPSSPRFTYQERHYGPDGSAASMPGTATFNAFTPALSGTSNGPIAPQSTGTSTITYNYVEGASTPPLGLMIVAPDNAAGAAQAQLIPLATQLR